MNWHDFVAVGSLATTIGLAVGFVMVTRNMVTNLKLDVKRINGMPVLVAETKEQVRQMAERMKEHADRSERRIETLAAEVTQVKIEIAAMKHVADEARKQAS